MTTQVVYRTGELMERPRWSLTQGEVDLLTWELRNLREREMETWCPECGHPLDQAHCELLCLECGLKFTCDE